MRRAVAAVLLVALVAVPAVDATQGSGRLVVESPADLRGRATMAADRPILHHISFENGSLTLEGDLTVEVRSVAVHENGSRRHDNETRRYEDGSASIVRGSTASARLQAPVRLDEDPPADYASDDRPPSMVVSPALAPVDIEQQEVRTSTRTGGQEPERSFEVRGYPGGNLSLAPIAPVEHDGGIDLALTSGEIVVDGDRYRTRAEQHDETYCQLRDDVTGECLSEDTRTVTYVNQTFVRSDDAALRAEGMRMVYVEDPDRAGSDGSPAGSATVLSADAWSMEMNATIRFGQADGEVRVGEETFPVDDTFVEVGGELDVDLAASAEAYRDRTGEEAPSGKADGTPVRVRGDVRYLRIGRTAETFPADPVAVGAAGLGVALIAAAAYLWPALKFAATKLVVAPFYAQVEGDDVLDNETRATIFEAIQSDPGLSATDLSRRADCGWGTVVYHLAVLEQNGMVISSRDGRHRRFFPYSGMDFRHKDVFSAIRNETTAAILDAIRDSPGIHQKALRKEVDLAASTVNWHVSKLEDAELVEKVRDGRKVRYHPGAKIDLLKESDLDPG